MFLFINNNNNNNNINIYQKQFLHDQELKQGRRTPGRGGAPEAGGKARVRAARGPFTARQDEDGRRHRSGGTAAGGSVRGGGSRRVKATPVQVTGGPRHCSSTSRHHAGAPVLPSGSQPSRPPQGPGVGFPLLLSGHHGHHPFCPVLPQHLGPQRAPSFRAGSCGRAGEAWGFRAGSGGL